MENKIPKKIHYIWVGGNPLPSDLQKCLATWKEQLKDYEIIEWNEKNFDIDSHPFCKAAYEAKKWAFVSDYIRAYVIYHEGGIYLDTDVLVLDNFDSYLNNKAFVGFENFDHPFTAAFGAVKHHSLSKDMLEYYDNLDVYNFNFNDNNTISVSNLLIEKYNCVPNNTFQILKEDIAVYPDTYLCNPSINSTCIHVFTGSWLENKKSFKTKTIKFLKLRLTTKKRAEFYRKLVRR